MCCEYVRLDIINDLCMISFSTNHAELENKKLYVDRSAPDYRIAELVAYFVKSNTIIFDWCSLSKNPLQN